MSELADRDYFTDHSILMDPYAYFEAIRARGPIYQDPESGIVMITGFDEILDVLKNQEDFYSIIAPQGPAFPLPFVLSGSDITGQVEEHRTSFVGGDILVAYDGPMHTKTRALLMPLFTPSRLKANQQFITDYSDELAKTVVANGKCDLIKEIATPFVTMVIADLLGVPVDDRQLFMDAIDAGPPPGSLNTDDIAGINNAMMVMGMHFAGYVQDRRENPQDDVLSELANATYPDGTTPDAIEIIKLGTFLFGAGQDTSAKLLGNAMRFIAEQPELQTRLRADPSLIPDFLEEALRLEGSTKMTGRLAVRDTRIGDLDVPAGTRVMLALAAANRDPRRWDNPQELQLGRPRIKEHLAFGRGAHVCAGAPLARVEVRLIIEKLFENTQNIELDEAHHGPAGNRHFDYEPSFIIRGLADLRLKLTPKPGITLAKPEAVKKKSLLDGLFGRSSQAQDEGKPQPYSTLTSKLGALLSDQDARAVLDKHFPGVSADPKIGMGKGLTLRAIQKFAPEMFTDAALEAADADLAKLPVA